MGKHFTAEFKLEAAKLVVDHGYTYVKAAEAVNVSHIRGEDDSFLTGKAFSPASASIMTEEV
ncbi:hypothetical protein ACWWJF_27450 [Symbiopectobacterium sp. Eva_TO]